MNTRRWIIAALMLTYPKTWRAEYGAELEDLLLAQDLSLRTVADVFASGVSERVRRTDPVVLCGLAMSLIIALGIVANVAGWPAFAFDWTVVLQPSAKTLPTVVVKPFGSEAYTLVLAGCGWWVVARRGGTVTQAGAAAARLTFIAGLPVMVVGLLLWFGVFELAVLDGTAALPRDGLSYSYYDAALQRPGPFAIAAAPLFALPLSWLWGTIGGNVARWTVRPNAGEGTTADA